MKILFILFLIISLGSGLMAQSADIDKVGTSAANFLKIGIGARAQGMASAYVAQADEITALYWNPAGITNITGRQVGLTHVDWVADIEMQFLGAVVSLEDAGSIGFSLTYLSMGEMKFTTHEFIQGTGNTFESHDFALGITYARRITDNFSVGITAKWIEETISQCTASAIAFDIGSQYQTGFHGLKLGMVISNFGGKMRMDGRDLYRNIDAYTGVGYTPDDVRSSLKTEEWPLPIAIRIGASMDFVTNETMRVTGNLDFYDPRDVMEIWSGGSEVALMDEMFFIRGGVTNYFEEELRACFGLGFKYGFDETYGLTIDYAYSDLGRLENANRFSLMFNF